MSYLKNLGEVKLAIIALIIANIIFGASFPIYKWGLDGIPPFTFVFFRFFLGALIILPFVLKSFSIARKDIGLLILISIIGISIHTSLMFFGLRLTPSINAPIIVATLPILLIFSAVIFLKEKLRIKVLIGTLISLLGALAIIFQPILTTGGIGGNFLGNFLIFAATLTSVITILLLKKMNKNYNPLTIVFWMFLLGSLPLIPLVFIELQSTNLGFLIEPKNITVILYNAIFPVAIAHFLVVYALKYLSASETGIFSYLVPIATVAVAIPLLGESISVLYVISSILVFSGIFIAEGHIRFHYHHFYHHHFRKKEEPN